MSKKEPIIYKRKIDAIAENMVRIEKLEEQIKEIKNSIEIISKKIGLPMK
jgi:hypothetical protein